MPITSIDQQIVEYFEGLFNGNGWGIVILAFLSLLCAALCAGIIGFEREYHGHAAGLRTHLLVALGSALVMIVSIYGFGQIGADGAFPNRDPARLAAQVVSGIGFLGAGTIMQTGSDVKGLTTATTLWLVMALGLASGSGNFIICGIATLIALFILIGLRWLERFAANRNPYIILVVPLDQPVLKEILVCASRFAINVKDMDSRIINYQNQSLLRVTLRVNNLSRASITAFADELREYIRPIDIKVTNEI